MPTTRIMPIWLRCGLGIKYYPMLWGEQQVTRNTEGHLVLKPK